MVVVGTELNKISYTPYILAITRTRPMAAMTPHPHTIFLFLYTKLTQHHVAESENDF